MNRRRLYSLIASAAVAGSMCASLSSPAFAGDSDQVKLKALQRALTTPPETDEFAPKSIVFDRDEKAAAPAEGAQQPTSGSSGDCSLLPADVKTTVVDFEIQFKLGSAELSPVSENMLMQIAKILALTPDRCVFVEGHTDSTGNADRNLRLSRERANSVVGFIVSKAGVLRSRLITAGKGSTETLKGLDPRDPKNRRVSFKVAG